MRASIREFVQKTCTKSYNHAMVPTTTATVAVTTSSRKAFCTAGTHKINPLLSCYKPTLSYIHPLAISQHIRTQRISITSTANAASISEASSQSKSTDNKTNNNNNNNKNKTHKTPGDIFLDNLGTLFLSAIGLLILALVRSSKGTTNKNNLRSLIETCAALDPFEIDDLRTANDEFTVQVFRDIRAQLEQKYGWKLDDRIDYKLFVSAVMQEMKGMKGEQFTIQLGHLMDRVIVSILEQQQQVDGRDGQGENDNVSDFNFDPQLQQQQQQQQQPQGLELRLLLVVLTLAMNSTVRERVQVLYDILATDSHNDSNDIIVDDQDEHMTDKIHVEENDVVKMVGYLQKTCQLVPDAQIVESKTKFPVQEYLVGSPRELVILGKMSKKEELSPNAVLDGNEGRRYGQEEGWSCDDFHHLLRSRHVCAWGECYVKTKSLT